MQKKDVIFLCQYFYPEYNSSATLPYDTALKLVQSGKSVGVLTGYPHEYTLLENIPKKEVYNNISIERMKYVQTSKISKLGRIFKFLSFTASALFKLNVFKKYEYIIVYSNPPILPIIAVLAKKLFGCKIIFVCYDVYPEVATKTGNLNEDSIVVKFMHFVNAQLYKNVFKIVALSDDMKNTLKNKKKVKQDKIVVIPNWYDDTPINIIKNENSDLIKIRQEYKFIVSYLGNMGTAQDMNTILEAIKNCQDESVAFFFSGHGNKVDAVRSFIKAHSLKNVFLFGFLHGDDYKTALKISDMFITSLECGLSGLCVPSKTYAYMMAGKPVVAIMDKQCDISKILENNDAGISVENGDFKKILSYIDDLKNNIERHAVVSQNSRKIYLQNYTKDICTSMYVKLFEN